MSHNQAAMAVATALTTALASGTAQADDPARAPAPAVDRTTTDADDVESRVFFEFDSDELTEHARRELRDAAAWIKQNDAGVIVIEGHADKVGSAAYNQDLSKRRGDAARSFLRSLGVRDEQILVVPYGEEKPVVPTEGPAKVNRRIVLTAGEEPSVSAADDAPLLAPVAPPDVPAVAPAPAELGIDILAGGGVTGFLDDHTNDVTDVGGLWTARVVGLTDRPIGFEAAYVGSAQDIDALGVDGDATVIGNGVEAAARLHIVRTGFARPYAFGGLGWTHYEVTDTPIETASIEEHDDVLHVPLGAGVTFPITGRVSLDLRATYRFAAGDDMFSGGATEPDQDGGLESLAGTGQLGFSF